MKFRLPAAICCLAFAAAGALPLFAQLAAPNASGISLGAVYYTVRDPEAHKKIWVEALGAKPVKVGATEMLKMPGVFIVLTKGEPAAGASFADHLGFWGKKESLDVIRQKLTAAGVQNPTQFINLPDGLRLEFVDDPMGPDGIAAHHMHFFVPPAQQTPGRAWYIKTFGLTEGTRRNGAVLSGLFTTQDKWVSVDFTGSGNPTANKGKVLDRFALEVKNLEAFVKKLQSDGVKVEKPYQTNADGIKTAVILDVLGNQVELTEGLAGK